jgi:ferredoxin
MNEITVTIIDREGEAHELVGPTDMNMNIMELCKAYELPVLGECGGMAMCATCQCYLESETDLPERHRAVVVHRAISRAPHVDVFQPTE